MSQGVLYIAGGAAYIDEAIVSARSVKAVSDLPITVVADREVDDPVFDTVVTRDEFLYHYGDSVLQIPPLPYDLTLLLDTDTYVTEGFDTIFDLPAFAEVAAAPIAEARYRIAELPKTVPELNTGVVVFRRSTHTAQLIDRWKRIYERYLQQGTRMNQPAFREALWETETPFLMLPPEYNCRANHGGYLTDPVRIVHAKLEDHRGALERLNQTEMPRVFFTDEQGLRVQRVDTASNVIRR